MLRYENPALSYTLLPPRYRPAGLSSIPHVFQQATFLASIRTAAVIAEAHSSKPVTKETQGAPTEMSNCLS